VYMRWYAIESTYYYKREQVTKRNDYFDY